MVHKQAGMKTYDEVNAAVSLLGYPTINAGCCKVPTPGNAAKFLPVLLPSCKNETMSRLVTRG